jgi:hypothetical protein
MKMKTFDELTKEQQAAAVTKATNDLIAAIIEGALCFNDKLNRDRLQARIDAALAKAEKMQTPWFSHEYIRDDRYVMKRLEGMARCEVENAFYSEGEHIIGGIADQGK